MAIQVAQDDLIKQRTQRRPINVAGQVTEAVTEDSKEITFTLLLTSFPNIAQATLGLLVKWCPRDSL